MITIQLMSLLYRAEVAASSETPEGLEDAVILLQEARELALDEMQTNLVNQKIDALNSLLTSAKSGEPEVSNEPQQDDLPLSSH